MWKTEHRRVHMSVVMRFLLRTLVRSIATAIAGGRSKVERRGRMADERWRVALSEVEGPERDEMELALRKGARFLMASTSEVYGDPKEHPQKESYWGHVNSIGVRSVYDEAKRFAEALTMAYYRKHNLRTRIIRIFNTFGPRMALEDGRVVPNFVRQAVNDEPLTVYGDGSATRSFCYVTDLVDGMLRLLWSDEPNPVNVGNPREMTMTEFAQAVLAAAGPECRSTIAYVNPGAARVADDPQRRRPDITRARTILGWEPQVSLEDGLRETLGYFRAVRNRAA